MAHSTPCTFVRVGRRGLPATRFPLTPALLPFTYVPVRFPSKPGHGGNGPNTGNHTTRSEHTAYATHTWFEERDEKRRRRDRPSCAPSSLAWQRRLNVSVDEEQRGRLDGVGDHGCVDSVELVAGGRTQRRGRRSSIAAAAEALFAGARELRGRAEDVELLQLGAVSGLLDGDDLLRVGKARAGKRLEEPERTETGTMDTHAERCMTTNKAYHNSRVVTVCTCGLFCSPHPHSRAASSGSS